MCDYVNEHHHALQMDRRGILPAFDGIEHVDPKQCILDIPSAKRLSNHGKSPFFMGKLTNSMAIFNS